MLRELNARQIAEWHAFWRLEPWGYFAEWERTALVAAVLANVFGDSKGRPITPDTFMPPFDPRKALAEQKRKRKKRKQSGTSGQARQTPEEQLRILEIITRAYKASKKGRVKKVK